ncbi:MAG TPA: energy-coupling factor transporter transmembrane protein EcfT [Clostridia bacterium]|nr:energy-coupling factor transporter transmembrane protein EcfT [Clostridia bacterium]
MIKDITIGQFIPGNSLIHRLDPRTKIISSIIYIIILFLAESFWEYLFLGLFTLSMIIISQVPLKFVLKGIKPLLLIIIFTLVLHAFLNTGTVIWEWGPFALTYEGIRLGLIMAFRLILLVVATSLLTLTTSPIALTDGIERLLSPFRRFGVPAHELAMMMTIALRFIPTLLEETEKIMKAQMARGADFESGNLIQRGKNMIPLLVPLFINAFRRADELAMAMEARCYRGGDNRTRMKQLKITSLDYFGYLTIAIVAAIVFII